jgi:hypothetical protein
MMNDSVNERDLRHERDLRSLSGDLFFRGQVGPLENTREII